MTDCRRHRAHRLCSAARPLVGLFAVVLLLFATFPAAPVRADDFPPYWNDGNPATNSLHYPLLNWPSVDADWDYYTHQEASINDARSADPSNGGRAPQNYANISSNCTDQLLPSVFWTYEADDAAATPSPTIFFRWRVEQIPNTYATGPAPGAYSNVDPWKSAQWTVLIDIDGDGYREFAVQVDGATGLPATPIDMLQSIYSNTESQSLDFEDDPDIYQLFHQPTAFIDFGTDQILNFRNALNPSPDWPNGSSETVWDYGSTRVTNVSDPTCDEFIVDYQIPVAMLDATSVGGPAIDDLTPFCLAFVTANSNENPLQKDFAFDGAYTFDVDGCVPCGDLITLAGQTIVQPTVDEVSASGCGPTTITATVRDAIDLGCTDTLTSVDFYSCYDADASGACDGAESWAATGGSAFVDADNPSLWTLTGWDTTSLRNGQHLVGLRAEDDQGNVTWSHLTQAEVDVFSPGDFANASPSPGVTADSFLNTCGEYTGVTKSVNPASTGTGMPVQFTITVDNSTSSPLNVNTVSDTLPPGFTYVSTDGGTLSPGAPTVAAGVVTWTFSPAATIAAGGTGTVIFTANVSTVTGTYTNVAFADTVEDGLLTSDPVDVGVGPPRLTVLKSASNYSVLPGDAVTYTLTYSNDSPVNATGVTITDPLPVGTTFVAATDGGVYDSLTRTITWSIGDLASLEGPYTVSFEVVIEKGANARTDNTATIASNETTPSDGTATIFVQSPLSLSKTSDKSTVDPAGTSPDNEVVFTIDYQNTGSANLTNVVITDTTLVGFSYLSNTGGGAVTEVIGDGIGNDDGVCDASEACLVTWTIGTLTPGSSGSVTLTLSVDDPYTGTANPALNTATASADQINDTSDSAEIGILEGDCQGNPDSYWFRDLDASVLPFPEEGGTPLPATSDRNYANETAPTSPTAAQFGPTQMVDSTEIELGHFYQDPPLDRPTGFSFLGNVDVWIYISKPGGSPVDITAYLYDYDPDTGVAIQIGQQQQSSCNGKCTNEEIAFSILPSGIVNEGNLLLWRFTGTGRNNPGEMSFLFDGTGSPSRGEVCFAPLSVTVEKQVDLLEANPSDTLTWTILFSNTGQRDVTGSQIVDTIPDGASLQTATLNGTALTAGVDYTCAGQVCTFDVNSTTGASGVIVGGESGNLVLTALIDDEPTLRAAGTSSLTNRAVLDTDDTDPAEDTVTTSILLAGQPEVVLMKSVDATRLLPGDTVTFTITALNVGGAAASTVVVTDVIPTDTYFTYVPASISGGDSSNDAGAPTLTWTVNTLATGATATLTFDMIVAAIGVPDGVTAKSNTATGSEATTTVADSNTVTVSISTNANIEIVKTVSTPAAVTDSAGTGDGSTTIFDSTLSDTTVQGGSVSIRVDGVEAGTDDSSGAIVGANLTASTIDYDTGALHLEFLAAPANTAAITAVYHANISPGDTVEYTIAVTNVGASDATGVTVSDPIPADTTYAAGTLVLGGAGQTDADDGDSARYDAGGGRVVFDVGTLTPASSETVSFSVVADAVMSNGITTVINTATASSAEAASKDASADSGVEAAPVLTISKTAPSTVPYPSTTLVGNHSSRTVLDVVNSQHINNGDLVYINGTAATVLSVDSATQITVDTPVSGNGSDVVPTIRYRITYVNSGTAEATNVGVKDILPVSPDINYITASPLPTSDPGFDANGILNWDVGTVAAGETGTITVWTIPTAAGTYGNVATLSSNELPNIDSNTAVTNAGALLLDKYTTTPAIVNDPTDGADQATWVITLTPQLNIVVTGVEVIDSLEAGFTYSSTTSITGGSCTTSPAAGDGTPTWSDCTITPAGGPMTITFVADLAASVGTGTYQNAVTAVSNELDVLLFDELITTAEDVAVTIPNDIMVQKSVALLADPCGIGCPVTWTITVTNVGTSTVASATVNDILPSPDVTWVSDDSGGTYNPVSGDWTVPVPLAPGAQEFLNIDATLNTTAEVQNCATRTASAPPDSNPANDTGCASIVPTPASVSGLRAFRSGSDVSVEWETNLEIGTVGFNLLRLDGGTGEFVRLNDRLLPGMINAPSGGSYGYLDQTAPEDAADLTYLLVEVDGRGGAVEHGPYTVRPGLRAEVPLSPAGQKITDLRAGYSRAMKAPSRSAAARLQQFREEQGRAAGFSKNRAGQAVKITTAAEGIHSVGASAIAALLNLTESRVRSWIGRGRFRLTREGAETAWLPAAENDGLFFFAEPADSPWTDENVYLLAPGRGRVMIEIDGSATPEDGTATFAETLHMETDAAAMPSNFSDPGDDWWMWDYVIAGDPSYESRVFPFDVPGVSPAAAQGVLTVELYGITEAAAGNDHHVTVSLNGTTLGEALWDGVAASTLAIPFDRAILNDGTNTLTITGILDAGVPYSYVYLNSFDVSYRRLHEADAGSLILEPETAGPVTVDGFTSPEVLVFDVTDPVNPVWYGGAAGEPFAGGWRTGFDVASPGMRFAALDAESVLVPAGMRAVQPGRLKRHRGAGYVIVTTGALAGAAQNLADYRAGRGLSSLVVTVEEIRDEFAHGVPTPLALREFIRFALDRWTVKPRYLLLAGEGTYDYRDIGGKGDNLVPPLMVPTPYGLFPSDGALADIDGDHVPEVAVGRLPVLTTAELDAFTARIAAYEAGSGEEWESHLLFAADDPDAGGDFPAGSEEVAACVEAGRTVHRVYLPDLPIADARTALQSEINSGVLLFNYVGHGSLTSLASEELLGTADMALLTNGGRLPVVTAMTCYVAGYGYPGYDSVGEALVLDGDGGAIALWGPSGLALNDRSVALDTAFYDAFFAGGERTLGDAVGDAMAEYRTGGNALFILDIYNILGDPALEIR